MACRQKMLMFGIFKACTSKFAYSQLYQRKLKLITWKKNALYFLIRPLDFLGELVKIRFIFTDLLKKYPEAVSKNEWHTSSAKLLLVSSGKAYSKQICLYKP